MKKFKGCKDFYMTQIKKFYKTESCKIKRLLFLQLWICVQSASWVHRASTHSCTPTNNTRPLCWKFSVKGFAHCSVKSLDLLVLALSLLYYKDDFQLKLHRSCGSKVIALPYCGHRPLQGLGEWQEVVPKDITDFGV